MIEEAGGMVVDVEGYPFRVSGACIKSTLFTTTDAKGRFSLPKSMMLFPYILLTGYKTYVMLL